MARVITDLHPRLQELIKKLKAECEKQGLKIGIGECVRTVAEQDALYAKGRTDKSSGIVTNAKGNTYSSMHQWGIAFDFYRNDGKGAYYDNDGFFTKVGKIGQKLGLEWGGTWTSIVDKPHFQLPDWGSGSSKIKSLYGTPAKFMATWKEQSKTDTTKTKAYTTSTTPSSTKKDEWVARLQKAIGATADGYAGPKTLEKTPTLKRGDKNAVVKLLQERLKSLGYNPNGVDGIFGAGTYNAVVKYQQKVVGLKNPDGEFTAKGKSWSAILGLK